MIKVEHLLAKAKNSFFNKKSLLIDYFLKKGLLIFPYNKLRYFSDTIN